MVSLCCNVGMIVGAKALYDILRAQFNPGALLSVKHYLGGGLWGGLLARPGSTAHIALRRM